jgi:replication-associated recombination protein RarA
MPPALKEEKRDNFILLGPDDCGKKQVANFLAQEHQRAMIRLDQLVDFWQKRGHSMAEEATTFLEQKKEELDLAIQE